MLRHARAVPVLLALAAAAAAQDKVDFTTQVRPILLDRCVECHGPDEQEGDLRLDRREHLFGGKAEDWVVQPGKPEDSLLLQRIRLPADDPDVMPAEGDLLSKEQIDVIRRWIAEGAEWPEAADQPDEAPPPPEKLLPAPLTDPQRAVVDAALERLRGRGAAAQLVSQEEDAVDVNLGLLRPPATDADVELLAGLEPALVWLNLSRSAVTDAAMTRVGAMLHLRRLHLAQTQVGDAGLARLRDLQQLRYLNLFGTPVTDDGLRHLEQLRALRQVYLWQTGVSEAGVARLRQARPELQVDVGGYADEIGRVAAELKAAEEQARAAAGTASNPTCPVSGEAIDPAVTLAWNGRTVAFCCSKCRARFEKEPDKFAPSLPPVGGGK